MGRKQQVGMTEEERLEKEEEEDCELKDSSHWTARSNRSVLNIHWKD